MNCFGMRVFFAFLITQQMHHVVSKGTEAKQFLGALGLANKPEINEDTLFRSEGTETKSYEEQKKELAQKAQDERDELDRWFTWPFWRMITMCAVTLLVYTEIIFPAAFCCVGTDFLFASAIFLAEMLSYLIVGCTYADEKAAGVTHALVLATIMCAMGFLAFLSAVSLKCQKLTKAQELVCRDLSEIFRPISYVVIVFLVVHGLLSETSSDWGNLTVFASMAALGLAFAMSGIIKDMMSYIFIRVNDYFEEGDYIYFGGELHQIRHVYWCYTYAYRPKTRSDMFIPNAAIAGGAINNQSKDNARVFEHDVKIKGSVEEKERIIKEAWALFKKLQDEGFTGLNGVTYECQVDIKRCSIYLTKPGNLHFKLFGLYYFSKPPQWKMSGPEPAAEARQMEWAGPWNYQIEWFILEMKRITAKK